MRRNRLYLILCVVLAASYGWASWSLTHTQDRYDNFTPCVFKYVTGIPCPSCGITRSVVNIARGNFINAVLINPLGFIAAAIMIVFPLWLLYDVTLKKDTLYKHYNKFENFLKVKWVAIPLVILVLVNWGWNIYKDL